MSMPRRIVVAIAVAALAALGAAVPAHAATDPKPAASVAPKPAAPRAGVQAWLNTSVSTTGVNIRTCPSTSCPSVGKANPVDPLLSFCSKAGDVVNGTQYWDTVYNQATGIAGYITEWYLNWVQREDCAALASGEITTTNQSTLNIRTCASTSCTVIGTLHYQELASSGCYMAGTPINGNPNWDVVYASGSSRFGFVAEYYLTNQSQEANCNA